MLMSSGPTGSIGGTSQWHSHKKNSPILEECIIFGFLLNSDAIQLVKKKYNNLLLGENMHLQNKWARKTELNKSAS